jgi:uncharacterized protein
MDDEIRVLRDFPRKVREVENTWIPMPDGARLAAHIWLPEDAEQDPVPVILEYLPYRKRDGTVERDHLTHPYFAGHGYACLRVDMRGTGDSEGVCKGEYLPQEQDDALAVLDWAATQPWSTGRAGMIGISWGGFNGLQVAARQPESLKAVITLCSTDDRYADDIHFMGGCVLTDKLGWGGTAFPIAMTPPDPAIVGDRWREMWKERLEGNGLWLLDWFRHQRRDAFYRHGSICENYADVVCPVYAVGGWADGYTNAIFRLLANLKGPRKGLVGPWGHKYPHFARPGPRIGFLQECLRWWDQWLKDVDTGVMREPMLRAWIEDPVAPKPYYDRIPGRWVAELAWPAPGIEMRALALGGDCVLGGQSGATLPDSRSICSPQTTGLAAGSWCGFGLDPDLSLDQRIDAGGSLIWETPPLDADLEILGFPLLDATIASDRRQAMLAAVLSDVAPDGAATRVSYGLLNLSHRESHAEPAALEPGRAYAVRVQLNACGKRFSAGHRIRLALSTAYWPVAFPPPEAATLTVRTGESRLLLPVRAARESDAALAPFGPPESAEPLRATPLEQGSGFARRATADQAAGELVIERSSDGGTVRHEHTGLEVGMRSEDRYGIRDGDPATAWTSADWRKSYARGDWRAVVETTARVDAGRDAFRIRARLRAWEGDTLLHEQEWDEAVPRDHA